MSAHDHERWESDLAAYALDALGPDEAKAVEAHLGECERCRADLRWLEPSVDVLAESVAQVSPPQRLRDELIATTRAEAGAGASSVERSGPRRAWSGWILRPATGLVAVAVIAAGITGYALHGDDDAPLPASEVTIAGTGPAQDAQAVLERDGDSGTLTVSDMPPARGGGVYQVWLQHDDDVAASVAFQPAPDGSAEAAIPSGSRAPTRSWSPSSPGAAAPSRACRRCSRATSTSRRRGGDHPRASPADSLGGDPRRPGCGAFVDSAHLPMTETCYRHPNRETNVACSRCARPICPDCMTPSPVGMRCPECAGERSRSTAVRFGQRETPYAIYSLMAINVIAFVAEIAGGGGAATLEGGGTLILDGGLFGPAVADGEWYRVVTSGFLHAGPLHLFLNMFVLYILGGLLEPAIGSARLVGIYFVSLLGGSVGALLLTPNELTVGASGAVYGLLAAAFLIARDRGIQQLSSQIGIWIVINLVFTFSIPGISIGGHLGGLAGGAAAAMVVLAIERRPGPQAKTLELAGMAGLAIVAFVLALAVA